MSGLEIGDLPPNLEQIANRYGVDHEEVGLDALSSFMYYTREEGLLPEHAYHATITRLHTTYRSNYEGRKNE